MKKINLEKCKSGNKGITLIALIITIIVLLILAGITINSLTGSDSAPAKANEAKQKNSIGVEKDTIGIVVNNQLMEAYDDIYIKNNQNVSIANAQNAIGQSVIDAVFIHYGGEARKTTDTTIIVETQVGDVSVKIEQQKDQYALITLKTRDFEEHGRIKLIGGQLIWDKNATTDDSNTPNQNPTDTPDPTDTPNPTEDPDPTVPPGPQGNSLEIGDSVTYTTTLNGQTLNSWKVFYIDNEENKVYLIYGGYLPTAAIPASSFESCYVDDSGLVENYDDGSEAIADLTNKESFSSLLTGTLTINEESKDINLANQNGNDIWAMGAPTIELFVNSWNANYSQNPIYYSYSSEGKEVPNAPQGITYYSPGYYIGNGSNPDNLCSLSANVRGTEGYNNALYFPVKSDNSEGYWIASLHPQSTECICCIQEQGCVVEI